MPQHSTPQLRFPEFSEAWEEKKFKQVLKIGSGKDYKHLNKGSVPVYGTGGIMTYVDDYIYEGESVGIGRKGTIDKPIFLNGKFWTVDTLFYTHSFDEVAPKFVFNIFQNIRWKSHNEASGVPSLSKNTIESITSYFPTLPEQQKIASFLSAADKKIEQLQQKKALLEQYKKGMMQKLFSQQVRFKDNNDKEFPEWEEKELSGACNYIKSGKDKVNDGNEYPVYGSTGQIGSSDIYSFDGLYILVARVGANAGAINIVKGKFCVTDNTLILDINAEENKFFIYYLLSKVGLNQFVFGSGQPLITGGLLKAINFLRPSFKEQTKIADFLTAIDAKINAVSAQLDSAKMFKKGLLQQMFV